MIKDIKNERVRNFISVLGDVCRDKGITLIDCKIQLDDLGVDLDIKQKDLPKRRKTKVKGNNKGRK